ncbi:hypothetical protein IW261DRAFT_636552 [Armillaria novae-zelandiae]|uniref:Uncharacterized protein n=1 Tax=Armillaria novae-zelandiae TaxID=153914 RepID=A0AA39ULE0_9AGAR|nr:hypothetical protein IW261DRAFT_636552 [Armillaria novae-zelandiae]
MTIYVDVEASPHIATAWRRRHQKVFVADVQKAFDGTFWDALTNKSRLENESRPRVHVHRLRFYVGHHRTRVIYDSCTAAFVQLRIGLPSLAYILSQRQSRRYVNPGAVDLPCEHEGPECPMQCYCNVTAYDLIDLAALGILGLTCMSMRFTRTCLWSTGHRGCFPKVILLIPMTYLPGAFSAHPSSRDQTHLRLNIQIHYYCNPVLDASVDGGLNW